LTQDGLWTYTWDGENRLIKMESIATLPTAAKRKLEFAYDYMGRRIQKKVYAYVGLSYELQTTTRFVYDGWNLISEEKVNHQSTIVVRQSFLWGLDLSGSEQGAGGVGGLLTIKTDNPQTTTFVVSDANGNVTTLVEASDGKKTAEYEYSPFGIVLKQTGPQANTNPFRFSTKYHDNETGLVYYGYRYYNPIIGRWLNRDPMEEPGLETLHNLVSFDTSPASEDAFIFELAQPDILSADESPLTEGNPYLGMRNNHASYIDPDGRNLIRLIPIIIKKISEAELKRRAKRATGCAAIHATYKATEAKARKCTPGMSAEEAAKNCALWSAVVAGRSLYLSKKCDYYLPGSIATGSKKAEAGHKQALAQTSAAMLACCSCALPEKK
jgi:RHS repeat-associated protein